MNFDEEKTRQQQATVKNISKNHINCEDRSECVSQNFFLPWKSYRQTQIVDSNVHNELNNVICVSKGLLSLKHDKRLHRHKSSAITIQWIINVRLNSIKFQ